jgi:hypothetical protein
VIVGQCTVEAIRWKKRVTCSERDKHVTVGQCSIVADSSER